MQLPPLTDLLALLGIDLVLCAAGLRLIAGYCGTIRGVRRLRWAILAIFVVLWFPVGTNQLPLLAYVRGISSDLSVTLVALSCLVLGQGFFGLPAVTQHNRLALSAAIALAAALLYPTALGWGNWDAYRLGWGSFFMLGNLLALVVAFLVCGLRLLPALVGLALLAWIAGLMETTNLWDYLMDPWLSVGAMIHCAKAGVRAWIGRYRRSQASGSASQL